MHRPSRSEHVKAVAALMAAIEAAAPTSGPTVHYEKPEQPAHKRAEKLLAAQRKQERKARQRAKLAKRGQ